jgi:methionyl-tRNA synthetase
MSKTYYITTAIDYTNGAPHIGHAYEKILADALTRYHRLFGESVFFLSGVDQHGQKVQQTAEKQGLTPEAFVDGVTQQFIDLWQRLGVSYDGWVATTDPRHKRVVQSCLQELFDDGQIYKGSTTGMYSVRQEQFLTDRDRNADGGFGPEWGEVEEREEENYYFRLSDHVAWLVKFLDHNPLAVFPESRMSMLKNAVAESVGQGQDLCISRPKSRLTWGIELPFDKDYVTFVWFDALINYISGAGYRAKELGNEGLPEFDTLWPCDAHIIGKDILVPAHGIYWLIMLHALGFPDNKIPRILVHGWWNARGEKMSKSLGNVVNPHDIANVVGVDGLRYYLLSDIATGADSDMSEDRVIMRYHNDLANAFGNLLNRTLKMANNYLGGVIPETSFNDELADELRQGVLALPGITKEALATYQIHKALAAAWEVLNLANTYIEKTQPFKLKEAEQQPQRAAILRNLAEAILHVSVIVSPVIPHAAEKIQTQLGWTAPAGFTFVDLQWGLLQPGHRLGEGVPLFPRVEVKPD